MYELFTYKYVSIGRRRKRKRLHDVKWWRQREAGMYTHIANGDGGKKCLLSHFPNRPLLSLILQLSLAEKKISNRALVLLIRPRNGYLRKLTTTITIAQFNNP
jgi:hypothetical protein